VGAALAEKLKGSGAIAVVFLGDGTMGQGAVYEGLNVASLWSLPLLFVLEDNQYAQSTPKALEHAGDIATRPETFAVDRAAVDVDDVQSVFEAAQRAVRHVREQSQPFFLALNTYRLGPHSKGDDTRSPDEIEAYRARDPLPRLAARLGEAERVEIEAQVEERVRQAVQAALEAGVQDLAEFAERMRWHTR
jgi:TPP-dependent pyruvate/acetoin dehydrogenase alpha subunit